MKNIEINSFDGSFQYNGYTISYRIIDNFNENRHDKMQRYIHFFKDGDNIGFTSIYGHVEVMTNITILDAENYFLESLEKGIIQWNKDYTNENNCLLQELS